MCASAQSKIILLEFGRGQPLGSSPGQPDSAAKIIARRGKVSFPLFIATSLGTSPYSRKIKNPNKEQAHLSLFLVRDWLRVASSGAV
jgi:hypothetical protein